LVAVRTYVVLTPLPPENVTLPDVLTGCDRVPSEMVAKAASRVLQLSVTNPVAADALPVKERIVGSEPAGAGGVDPPDITTVVAALLLPYELLAVSVNVVLPV
jgi:hypothetical protein